MMLFAIHKKSGREVSAEKVLIDSSWIGSQKDEWLCPEHYILTPKIERLQKGIEEVKMCFVNSTDRRVHFRRITEGVRLIEDVSESYEHKIAKEKIYELLWDKKIRFLINNQEFNIEDLSEFDIFIEERIGTSHKVADVLIRFEDIHPILNKGIVFEIQLSNQTEEITLERTYSRVLEGYCVKWLWLEDFDDSMNLKNNLIEIKNYKSQLEDYKNKCTDEMTNRIREYSWKIDDKLKQFKDYTQQEILNLEFKRRENKREIKEIFEDYKKDLEKQSSIWISDVKQQFEHNIKAMLLRSSEEFNKEFDKVLPKIQEEVIYRVSKDKKIKELVYDHISNFTKDEIKNSDELKSEIKSNINSYKKEMSDSLNNKLDKESKKIIESLDYSSCLREKFGVDLGEFARIYLDSKIYEIKKEMAHGKSN